MWICTHIHVGLHTCTHMYTDYVACVITCMYVHMYTYVYSFIHTYIHAYMHTHLRSAEEASSDWVSCEGNKAAPFRPFQVSMRVLCIDKSNFDSLVVS